MFKNKLSLLLLVFIVISCNNKVENKKILSKDENLEKKELINKDEKIQKIENIYEIKNDKSIEEIKEEKIEDLEKNDYEEDVLITSEDLKDIFRFKFKERIKLIDPEINLEDIDFSKYLITKEDIIIGDEKKISLNLEKFKSIFKVNRGLPTIYNSNEVFIPKKRELDPNKKHIVFSFDDGPLNENHELIRELFNEYDETAVFAVVGKNVRRHSAMLLKTYLDGHEIISHTQTHPDLSKKSDSKILEEIIKSSDEIFKVTGYDVKYLRPPYGSYNSRVKKILEGRSNIVLWNVDSEDWKNRNSEIIINRVLPNIKDGDVVLFHDLYPETYEAVKFMLPILKQEGFQFISYEDMMKLKSKK